MIKEAEMAEKLWAEIDEDWRRKEERTLAQRAANLEAQSKGVRCRIRVPGTCSIQRNRSRG